MRKMECRNTSIHLKIIVEKEKIKVVCNSELTQIESEIILLRNQMAQNLIKIGLKLIDAKKDD